MLFNSYTFFIFFALVLLATRFNYAWHFKKSVLLFVSYIFYAAWNPPFVILLWLSTVIDWFLARFIDQAKTQSRKKLFLITSLLVNLGMLAFFKYGDFLAQNFVWLANHLGWQYHPALPSIILPVGISFYTFQTLSYTLDVYRGEIKPWHSFLDYALYVTFFPQLVAGPIVRAVEFLPQCVEPKVASNQQLGWGLTLFIIGLFNKMVIADGLMAPAVQAVFDSGKTPDFINAWGGTMAFATQIFCDFAGYSTCAIGVGLCFGFVLPDNFRFPYAAVGLQDFWRRWHISLSTWLRDYLYIPLGGSRCSNLKIHRNLMLTMLLGGLWHGASWTFVMWGALHGFYQMVERALRKSVADHPVWHTHWMQLCLALLTFILVCFAWVFFRAQDFHSAWTITSSMLGMHGWHDGVQLVHLRTFIIVAIVTALHWTMRHHTVESVADKCHWSIKATFLAVMMVLIFSELATGEDHAFIYFQF